MKHLFWACTRKKTCFSSCGNHSKVRTAAPCTWQCDLGKGFARKMRPAEPGILNPGSHWNARKNFPLFFPLHFPSSTVVIKVPLPSFPHASIFLLPFWFFSFFVFRPFPFILLLSGAGKTMFLTPIHTSQIAEQGYGSSLMYTLRKSSIECNRMESAGIPPKAYKNEHKSRSFLHSFSNNGQTWTQNGIPAIEFYRVFPYRKVSTLCRLFHSD